jgi:dTDP-4-dehydrorhamnose reductase
VRVLLTGAGGQVGRDLLLCLGGEFPPAGVATALMGEAAVAPGEFEVAAFDRAALDVTDAAAVDAAIDASSPEVIVHLAAYTAVDRAESDPDGAWAVNEVGTRHVAAAAERAGAHLVYVSTDYVFPGLGDRPLVESDAVGPRSVYGATKLAGEQACPASATIARTSWVAGIWNRTVITLAVEAAAEGRELRFVADQVGSPTSSADLAAGLVALVRRRPGGVLHVAGGGRASWAEVIDFAYQRAGGAAGRVHPIATAELDPPQAATRPRFSVLGSERLGPLGLEPLPDWHEGIGRLVDALVAGA